MLVSVDKISNVLRRLAFVIPAEEVKNAYADRISQFARTTKLKGFRLGKVPRSYIEQTYGDELCIKVLGDIIEKSFKQALVEKNLQPVSDPQLDPKKFSFNEPFEFAISFEVLPEN